MSRPSTEKAVAPSRTMKITSAKCVAVSPVIGPMMSRAIGSTKSAAISPCITPADDLLERDELERDRREQAVLDLARPAEVRDHRQRNRLHAREREAHREHAREQRGLVRLAHVAHAWQQQPEDDDEEQRLQRRAQQKIRELAPRDVDVAPQEREEDARRGRRAARRR